MPFPASYLLIIGGVCACAPLFKRISKALGRLLSGLGFLVGIAVLIVGAALALDLTIIKSYISSESTANLIAADPILKYYIPVMLLLGILLVARPIRNIRWASLVGLGVGITVTYYLHALVPSLSSTILIVVFLVATVAIYTLLRFVEDILEFIGQVLAFPPVAVAIGLASLYFGILMAALP